MNPAELVTALADAYAEHADPAQAAEMSAYVRDQFTFFGIRAAERRAVDRAVAGRGPGRPEHHYLVKVVRDCWEREQREFQYFAVDYLRRHHRRLDDHWLEMGRELVVTGSWWDTVDPLAAGVVGPYVRSRGLAEEMDRWVVADNVWVARAALLHQLAAKEDTDVEQLFTHCLQRSADVDPFIRKAIGWALRQHSRTDPGVVRKFVETNRQAFAPVVVREALKHLDG